MKPQKNLVAPIVLLVIVTILFVYAQIDITHRSLETGATGDALIIIPSLIIGTIDLVILVRRLFLRIGTTYRVFGFILEVPLAFCFSVFIGSLFNFFGFYNHYQTLFSYISYIIGIIIACAITLPALRQSTNA